MGLTGPQLGRLQEALLRAFPDRGSLAQMLLHRMDVRLNQVAGEGNLSATAFQLIQWAEAQGRLDELVRSALTDNPGSPELQSFATGIAQVPVIYELAAVHKARVWPAMTASPEMLVERMARSADLLLKWPKTVRGGHRIPLSAEEQIRESITGEHSSNLLLGPKGSGKSALLALVGNKAREDGAAVLAIKADRMPAMVDSLEALRDWLQLPMPVLEAISQVAAIRKVVVLLDQLDSISELTDRRTERLNVLLELIRDLDGIPNVHLIASCREFDHRHDTRLRSIESTQYQLELPAWDVVAPILEAEGYDPATIGEATRELLRTPWHLDLFLKIGRPLISYSSLHSLIEEVWQKSVTDAGGPANRLSLLECIALRMSESEELFVPISVADDLPEAREALLHEDILVREDRQIGFRHQTYFDFCLVRSFERGSKSLADYVLERQDSLFVRPTMLAGLAALRDTARGQYRIQAKRILVARPRRHIRSLLLEYVAQQADPDDFEVNLLLPYLKTEEARLVLGTAAGSPGWFQSMRESEELASVMQAPPDQAIYSVDLLAHALRFDEVGVYRLVERHWLAESRYDRLSHAVASHLPDWNEKWVDLVCRLASRSDEAFEWTAEAISRSQPDLAPLVIRAEFNRQLELAELSAAKADQEGSAEEPGSEVERDAFEGLIQASNNRYGLKEIAEAAPRAFLGAIWPWFKVVLSRCRKEYSYPGTYQDDRATWGAYSFTPVPLIEALHAAADGWADNDPLSFLRFVSHEAESDLLAVHRILAQGLVKVAPHHPDDVLSYLAGDSRRLMLGTYEDQQEFTCQLVSVLVIHLSQEDLHILEQHLLAFKPFEELSSEVAPADRHAMSRYGRKRRLQLLKLIPAERASAALLSLRRAEDNLLADVGELDPKSRGGWIGPRVTAEELAKANDGDILNLISEIGERESKGEGTRWDLPLGRAGGSMQQSREMDKLAEQHPERGLGLLSQLDSKNGDHVSYAGALIEGLGKSNLPLSELISTIESLEERGFTSDECRVHAAIAIDERTRRQEAIPSPILDRLARWLENVDVPCATDYTADSSPNRSAAPIVFGHGSRTLTLMQGRATLIRTLASAYSQTGNVDGNALHLLLRSRVGKEKHPEVWAEMLYYLQGAFNGDVAAATGDYDAAIRSCPEVLDQEFAWLALANITGYCRPEEMYQDWLQLLVQRDLKLARQAYGELLFLYSARKQLSWATERIDIAIEQYDPDIMRGLIYGARAFCFEPHCRSRATDLLCLAAGTEVEDLQRQVEFAFIPKEGEPFPVDGDTRRLVTAVCAHPMTLRLVGSQMLEALSPDAGRHPDLLLQAGKAVLAVLESSPEQLANPLHSASDSLTSIALTLHRQPAYREEGLVLFEDLLRLGVREAKSALEQLDRRPRLNTPLNRRPRRPRRRR